MYENLWEDERIEELVREGSPGFAAYVQAAKHSLLEQGEPAKALEQWDKLPDMDRVNALIFAFIRIPHRIPSTVQQWTVVSGECVFQTLRRLFPHGPRHESDVEEFAARLQKLWNRIRKLYPSIPEEFDSSGLDTRSLSEETVQRVVRQIVADAVERSPLPATADPAQRLVVQAARLYGAGASTKEQRIFREAAERLLKKAHIASDKCAKGACEDHHFGVQDVERVLESMSTICRPLDANETEMVERLETEKVALTDALGDTWDWGGSRRTEITYPRAGPLARARYNDARLAVRHHVQAMRAAFASRLAERVRHERGKAQGRIDPRRLAQATISDRIFRRTHVQAVPGLAICLLLDESGSMACEKPSRATIALRVAVLVAEALRGVPGIELEVYAHSSCGDDDRDCLVRYLYGMRNQDQFCMGCYGPARENYDHQAISTAGKLFLANTKEANRSMIVLSDGAPAGRAYGGSQAIQATKEAVGQIRRQGIKVLNVAISDYKSEAIFGKDNVLKFTDLSNLVENMRRLIVRLVRRAS
jgi:hypothetical protein